MEKKINLSHQDMWKMTQNSAERRHSGRDSVKGSLASVSEKSVCIHESVCMCVCACV